MRRINSDGTVNISHPFVQYELKQLGLNGCMGDSDCACSAASHTKDDKILTQYVKDHKDEGEVLVNQVYPWQLTVGELMEELMRYQPGAIVAFIEPNKDDPRAITRLVNLKYRKKEEPGLVFALEPSSYDD